MFDRALNIPLSIVSMTDLFETGFLSYCQLVNWFDDDCGALLFTVACDSYSFPFLKI